MKALVAYLSQTGNTKKVAEAIFEELSCEKELFKMEEVTSVEDYDIVIAGFPVWQFGPAAPAGKFLAEHSKGIKIALFVTHAMDPESSDSAINEKLKSILHKCKTTVAEGKLVGFYNCRGELSTNIADFLLKSDDPVMKKFGEMRSLTIGHPDSSEINNAKVFAREIIDRIN